MPCSVPKIFRARSTATEAIETELEPICVSERTFLATVKARLDQLFERTRNSAHLTGDCVGLLHLPKNLRLAHHHRVQRAGHTEQVAHGLALAILVEVWRDCRWGNREILIKKTEQVRATARTFLLQSQKLHAITGGKNNSLADTRLMGQRSGRVRKTPGGNSKPFTNLYRSRGVVDADEHEW